MQCINKIKAGFTRSGDLTFKPRSADPGTVGFEFECRKCLPCLLNIAREKAIRATHEAHESPESIFLTLTYAPEYLKSPKLQYTDFQLFMKSLRELHTRDVTDPELRKQMSISYMVTGEYGGLNKRPHWHALIFNYRPKDLIYVRTTDLGHKIFKSPTIERLWGRNNPELAPNEIGDITLESAGYVARYGAKALAHNPDFNSEFPTIHKTSSKHAIGKRWIEKYWKQTFDLGFVRLPDGSPTKIPRYYCQWLRKHHPDQYVKYVTTLREDLQKEAKKKSRKEEIEYLCELFNADEKGWPRPITRKKVKLTILKQKFKNLQEKLKL